MYGGSSSAACQAPALQRVTPQHSGTLYSFITFTKFGPKSNLPSPPGKGESPCMQLVQPKLPPRAEKSLKAKKRDCRSVKAFGALMQFLQTQQSLKRKNKCQSLVAKRHLHRPWKKPSMADEGQQSRKDREGGRGQAAQTKRARDGRRG